MADCSDLHLGNIVFTIPNTNSYTVDELYAAIGRPKMVPIDTHPLWREDLGFVSHQPKFLVDTPSVVDMWALCKSPVRVPSVCLIDFTESFHIPFNLDHPEPGTPLPLAAPELILGLLSEITTGIDIWAFACTSWELLGEDSLFNTSCNSAAETLADMIFLLRGNERENIPKQFWKIFWEELRGELWFEHNGRPVSGCTKGWMELGGTQGWMDWEGRFKHLRGSKDKPLSGVDEAVLRRVLKAALLFEPTKRATAKGIVHMLPESWAN